MVTIIGKGIHTVAKYVKSIIAEYIKHHGNLMAKGIAFSIIFTFIPILMVSLWVFTEILADMPDLQSAILAHLLDILPQVAEEFTLERIEKFATQRVWQQMGIFGIGILIFAPGSLFASIEQALYTIMQTYQRRGFFLRHLFYFTLHFVVILVMILFTFLGLMLDSIVPLDKLPESLSFVSSGFVSTIIITVSLVMVYRMSFHGRLKRKVLVGVSLLVSILWQVLNTVGNSIITVSGRNELFYGILAGVAVVMLWAFFFSQMLLFGAIIIAKASRKLNFDEFHTPYANMVQNNDGSEN